jgi:acyl-CoA reductase-like NAD-dependent aldehyde dehydrogenase
MTKELSYDEHAAEVVARARAAQQRWVETPVRERADALRGLKARVLGQAEHIGNLLAEECGKPFEEAVLAEVLPSADLVDYWTASIEEILAPEKLELDPIAFPSKQAVVYREARGVIALVSPWNYPVAIPLRTLVPALLAGNAVVLKPSEVTPRAGELVASLFEGLVPVDLVGLLQGGGDAGAALVRSDVDAVVFTGSVATGRKVAAVCAERLVPCALELGGKDAAIVLGDAPIERTARGLVWGAFTNAGQNCASIERVYVVRSIADALSKRVVELTKELRVGKDVGKLTTLRQAEVVRAQLEAAVEAGAELRAGGVPEPGTVEIAPVVLAVEQEDGPLMNEETFGPVLPIVVVEDEAEAIRRANASRFGLTASVWTKRTAHGHEIAKKLRAGVVTINNHAFTAAIPAAPWSGVGESGFGVTNSPHALGELVRPRLVLEDRNALARELWWYPYTATLRGLAMAMAELRGGAGLFGRVAALFRLLTLVPRRLFEKGPAAR